MRKNPENVANTYTGDLTTCALPTMVQETTLYHKIPEHISLLAQFFLCYPNYFFPTALIHKMYMCALKSGTVASYIRQVGNVFHKNGLMFLNANGMHSYYSPDHDFDKNILSPEVAEIFTFYADGIQCVMHAGAMHLACIGDIAIDYATAHENDTTIYPVKNGFLVPVSHLTSLFLTKLIEAGANGLTRKQLIRAIFYSDILPDGTDEEFEIYLSTLRVDDDIRFDIALRRIRKALPRFLKITLTKGGTVPENYLLDPKGRYILTLTADKL